MSFTVVVRFEALSDLIAAGGKMHGSGSLGSRRASGLELANDVRCVVIAKYGVCARQAGVQLSRFLRVGRDKESLVALPNLTAIDSSGARVRSSEISLQLIDSGLSGD
jgi:hypothetical protein